MSTPEPTSTSNQQIAVHAIEKALGLTQCVHTLADTDKDTVEHLLELALEALECEKGSNGAQSAD